MNLQQHQSIKRIESGQFILLWGFGLALGFALSISILGGTYSTFAPLASSAADDSGALMAVLLGLLGLVLASAVLFALPQWLVLRHARLGIRYWFVATAIGFILGIFADVILINLWTFQQGFIATSAIAVASDESLIATFVSLIAATGLVLGAAIGVTQWIVIRRLLAQSGWWVIATMLSFGLSVVVVFVLSRAIPQPIPLVVGGLIFGVLATLPFRYLLDYPATKRSAGSPDG